MAPPPRRWADGIPVALRPRSNRIPDVEIVPSAISLNRKQSETLHTTREITIISRIDGKQSDPPVVTGLPDGIGVMRTSLLETQTSVNQYVERWRVQLRIDYLGNNPDVFSAPVVRFERSGRAKPVPISIRTSGIRCSPQAIQFNGAKIGVVHYRRFLIHSADQTEFSVNAISQSSSVFRAKCDLGKPGSKHWVDVFFEPTEPGICADELLIVLDHPDTKRLVVRVVGNPAIDH
jgi:hypothetical protein